MFARKPGKGITLEMYIRNTQVNKKKGKKIKKNYKSKTNNRMCSLGLHMCHATHAPALKCKNMDTCHVHKNPMKNLKYMCV